MTRVFKLSIFFCLSAIILIAANYALAQGKGFIFEKDDNLYIYDNLYINGYLVLEGKLSSVKGLFGDVLIEKDMTFNADYTFYFCADDSCANKNMIWSLNGLNVTNANLYKLNVNDIEATAGEININTVRDILTSNPVKVAGCFSNDGSNDCEYDQNNANSYSLHTTDLYIDNLTDLRGNVINLKGSQINFDDIDLGPQTNLGSYICIYKDWGDSCDADRNGGINLYENTTFADSYTLDQPASASKVLCCRLCITNFSSNCQ